MSILSTLFPKLFPEKHCESPKIDEYPKIGETWVLIKSIRDGSPWLIANSNPTLIKILDVQSGWIRYKFIGHENDERIEEYLFRKIYEKFYSDYMNS